MFFPIDEISHSVERHKIYVVMCRHEELSKCIDFVQNKNIKVIDVGKELGLLIEGLKDNSDISIDVSERFLGLLEDFKLKINDSDNYVIAVHNLGILLEPVFKLKPVQLLKDFSKTAVLIIIWENQFDSNNILHWPTKKNTFRLDFGETLLKRLVYEI